MKLQLVSASIVAACIAVSFSLLDSNTLVNAQLVVRDEMPTNATEELDVKIYPTEALPANGTVIVDITEADDIDIETIPPEGVTIVMTNTTITLTNQNIEIPDQVQKDKSTIESIKTLLNDVVVNLNNEDQV